MTKRTARHNQYASRLKVLLLSGSVIATLAGTHLLAQQEPVKADISISASESIAPVVQTVSSSPAPRPRTNREIQIELKPIPQVVQPRLNPVARTQSSR